VFDLDFFETDPRPFYQLAKGMLDYQAKPTINHFFIKLLDEKGLLHLNITQNIDGLEQSAGVDMSKVVQAHGHLRSAACTWCREKADIQILHKMIRDEQIMKCSCGGYIKPDITFFGEQLPSAYYVGLKKVAQADLMFVMGTSLVVAPVSGVVYEIDKSSPIVLLNRENSLENKLSRDQQVMFLGGDLDANVSKLIADLGWDSDLLKVREKARREPSTVT
jgi:NAD-dependent SIR2 family protein deacetylase